jgi:hypothetical protein
MHSSSRSLASVRRWYQAPAAQAGPQRLSQYWVSARSADSSTARPAQSCSRIRSVARVRRSSRAWGSSVPLMRQILAAMLYLGNAVVVGAGEDQSALEAAQMLMPDSTASWSMAASSSSVNEDRPAAATFSSS